MPELPEVETVCRGLSPAMLGVRIRHVTLNRPDLRIPFPTAFAESITGACITGLTRRAKYLLFTLDNEQVVLAHLGMSGKMVIQTPDSYQPGRHDHVVWELDNGLLFIFSDPRRFGLMTLMQADQAENHPLLAHLGPEPLGNQFSAAYLTERLKGKKTAIKQAIMDQQLVVGVGNIYASEALFISRISPFMPAGQAVLQADKLVLAIQSVLRAAIVSGGSTLRDYVRSDGDIGYFQHHFQVYGRDGERCLHCESPVSRAVQGGRATFFCHKCQMVK